MLAINSESAERNHLAVGGQGTLRLARGRDESLAPVI